MHNRGWNVHNFVDNYLVIHKIIHCLLTPEYLFVGYTIIPAGIGD